MLAAAVWLSGCGGDEAPPDALRNRAATLTPVAAPAWGPCEAVFPGEPGLDVDAAGHVYDCALVRVPLDYAEPDGATLDIALRRKPAGDPAARVGSLVIEPGGPGGSGVDSVPDFVAKLSAEVAERFDIVGFDPRGVGRTRPSGLPAGTPALPCGGELARYFANDLADTSPAGTQALDAAARSYAQICAGDRILAHMGTMNVARDLEMLRRALGDERLTYIGVSYGTEIGIVYADLYPTRVRAMILDGVVNPARSGEDILVAQAVSWNKGLENFFAWCASAAEAPGCAIAADPAGSFQAMLAKARTERPDMMFDGERLPLSSGWLTLGAVLSIYGGDPAQYASMAAAIADALGDPPDWTALSQGASALANQRSLGPAVWTGCLDQPLPGGAGFEAFVARAAAAAPLVGAVAANINRPCAFLPVAPDPVPTDYRAAGSPPIMVWGTTGDPATPWQNSADVAEQLANAALFTFVANQHVAMGGGPNRRACVVEVQSAYLVSAELVPQTEPCDGQ